ncbi:phosphodiesterase [Chachezhania sediminis]|uniref:phosphodiesterase n=1 Tax=Chachezhania sediminis TaxID=2599291 RepID=UPI00131D85E8|nr:phosphodiesterase [Chachezhania sediminis]
MLIAHLSDPHLREAGVLYQGLVDSNAMFDRALETLAALDPAPDIVIIGGDLVDEGRPAEYASVIKALSRLRQPVFAIPGNHDERVAFRSALGDFVPVTDSGPLHFDTGTERPVRILGWDITVPGDHHGQIDEDAIAWLETRLAEAPDQPTAILMHQPPVNTGIHFIDAYRCFGESRLGALLPLFPNVERILCGHVHRSIQTRFAGVPLTIAPSTSSSIALRLAEDAEPASYVEPPAFLLHDWRGHGPMVTHWVPVGQHRGPLPYF